CACAGWRLGAMDDGYLARSGSQRVILSAGKEVQPCLSLAPAGAVQSDGEGLRHQSGDGDDEGIHHRALSCLFLCADGETPLPILFVGIFERSDLLYATGPGIGAGAVVYLLPFAEGGRGAGRQAYPKDSGGFFVGRSACGSLFRLAWRAKRLL